MQCVISKVLTNNFTFMDLRKIGDRIREIRKQNKISQADISDKLEISITAFSKIERGLTNQSINRLEQISNILGVSIFTLFYDENSTKNHIDNPLQNDSYSTLEKELAYTKELLKAKDEIIELLKNKLQV